MASMTIQNPPLGDAERRFAGRDRRPYLSRIWGDDGCGLVLEVTVQWGDSCSFFDITREELAGLRETISSYLGDAHASPGEVIDWMQKQDVPCTEVESSGLTSMESLTDGLIDLCADAREKFGVPS